ncbi:MAG: hypothetical protein H6647_09030 [Anaerolineales bacterium]|nr:hypothetical protein [Anaerolineales bacterium]
MRRRLEMQADRIEAVLASHKVQGRVWGGTVTPRFIRFQVMTSLDTKVNRVSGLSEEIALSLGVPATRVYRQNGAIQVEVPRGDPEAVRLLPLCRRLAGETPPGTAVLGVDEEGTPLLVKLSSPDVVHVLVAGTTGSGKTALARSFLLSLALFNRPDALRLVLIDPKGRGFGPLAGLPHLLGRVATTTAEGALALEWLVGEMEQRPGRSLDAGTGGGHRRAGRSAGDRRQGGGAVAPAIGAARPGGRCPSGGLHAEAVGRGGQRAVEGQLPGAAGGVGGQPGGCQGGVRHCRDGRREADGTGRLPAGGQGRCGAFPGGLCGGG